MPGAGPQRSLGAGAGVAQREPRSSANVAVALVGEAGVGDRDAAAQRESAGEQASILVSMRETKNEATDAIASRGCPPQRDARARAR